MAYLHMPERVVAVKKHPRCEISCRGCFDIATMRSGFFFFRSLSIFPLITAYICGGRHWLDHPCSVSCFGGLVVSMLASGTQDHGSLLAKAVGFFQAKKKILSMPSFGREVKPFAPCRRFAACQRTL
jgi:hypothetical protein